MRSKRIQSDGSGNGPESDLINRILDRLKELQFYDSQTVKVEQLTRGTRFHAAPQNHGGSSIFPWMYPTHVELDPRLTYSKGFVAYASALSPLVTTGIVDLVAGGDPLTCQPGYWLALKNVPAQVTVSGIVKYNVPQLAENAIPTGTPLNGDLDVPTLFWAKIPETNSCM